MTETTQDPNWSPTPAELGAYLEALVDVTPLGGDAFRGGRRYQGSGRVYGGQVIAQALSAASHTVDPARQVHSLHAYFLRAASEDMGIDYRVTREFDGRSFSNRRVIASQNGEPVLNFSASFQLAEGGRSFQAEMPRVPGPEELPTTQEYLLRHADRLPQYIIDGMARPNPLETRSVGAPAYLDFLDDGQTEPLTYLWVKTKAPVTGPAATHAAILAYITDMPVLSASVIPHTAAGARRLRSASLDHAVWFHEPVRADEWLLFVSDSTWSGHARAFGRSMIFTRDGRHVGHCSQEGLLRLTP